jgi:two-component system KDP operon response regulator KdpE
MTSETKRAKILIVDDESDIRELLNIGLRKRGYDTAFAGDAIAAVSVARKEMPDLILLDLGLPGGEGLLVLERLRAIASLGWVPVIVVSARGDSAAQRALDAGAKAYFPKPIDLDRLVEAIERELSPE